MLKASAVRPKSILKSITRQPTKAQSLPTANRRYKPSFNKQVWIWSLILSKCLSAFDILLLSAFKTFSQKAGLIFIYIYTLLPILSFLTDSINEWLKNSLTKRNVQVCVDILFKNVTRYFLDIIILKSQTQDPAKLECIVYQPRLASQDVDCPTALPLLIYAYISLFYYLFSSLTFLRNATPP